MGYHYDIDYKLHAVKYYLKNKNYVETCKPVKFLYVQ